MIDGEGTVVGGTNTAQRLDGYSAGEVVGRPAWFVLPFLQNAPQVWAVCEQRRARGSWSGPATIHHRDGHTLHVSLHVSLLWGRDGAVHWLVTGTNIAALSAVEIAGSVRESLLIRTPIGIVVRDLELRCAWVSDVNVTLLLARTRAVSPCQTVAWDLPWDPAVVRIARRLVTRQLIRWGLESLVTDTVLIVGELVTHAIRHGAGAIALRLIKHQLLSYEVSEAGRTCPRLRHTRSTDEDGRGILLVSQLSRRWGRRRITGGKVVWAEQELPHPVEGESDTGILPDLAGAAWPKDPESRGEELT
ncbi:ATP-binding protein [Streptomyces inhibens]|uniref:ATP-binding protein n=1 Tax=Streptomyces inhibens TaxID=2293571 RepID=UPI001EE6E85C|nr:ATP-binding protein [Streptomyces inhibens]UKY54911.1 hypothetical protein KI385_43230 [Streptomyces inhibens]